MFAGRCMPLCVTSSHYETLFFPSRHQPHADRGHLEPDGKQRQAPDQEVSGRPALGLPHLLTGDHPGRVQEVSLASDQHVPNSAFLFFKKKKLNWAREITCYLVIPAVKLANERKILAN